MHRVLFTSLDAAIAGLILAPAFYFLNKKYIHNRLRSTLYCIFAIYLCAIFAVAGLPDIRYIRFNPHINLSLFAYMFSDATSSLLNVLLFIPMGIFLPILWKDYHPLQKTLLFGFFTSLFVETLQIFTLRATDVNDLLTNTTGTILGWCFAHWFLSISNRNSGTNSKKEPFIICFIVFIVMFLIHPFLSEILYPYFTNI